MKLKQTIVGAVDSIKSKHLALTGAALSVLPPAVFAQGEDPFMVQATAFKAKIALYGAELVLVAAVGIIFMLGIKYVKKLPKAA